MTDLEILKKIEKILNNAFKKVKLDKISEYQYSKIAYSTSDDKDNIIGLKISLFKDLFKDECLTYLKELKNLNHLSLENNNINNITHLKDLKNLTYLDLSNNQISNILHLKELKNLSDLSLNNNQIEDISHLKELKNLINLNLEINDISDISHLKNLKQLTNLNLSSNYISDISTLKELKNLIKLNIRKNIILDISSLKDLSKIKKLEIDFNKVSDVSYLKNLTKLENLDLSYNKIADISDLKTLKNLTKLWLNNNQIEDISCLINLKELKFLYLYDNKVSFMPRELFEIDVFYYENNPIQIPPPDILERGKEAILSFFELFKNIKQDTNHSNSSYVCLMIDIRNQLYKIESFENQKIKENFENDKLNIKLIWEKTYPRKIISQHIKKALHGIYIDKKRKEELFEFTDIEIEEIKEILN